MTEQKNIERTQGLIEAIITVMGGPQAAASAMAVADSTVYRWRKGDMPMTPTAVALARAILRHPGEFAHHKKGGRDG